jgi:hypothetical protein
VKDVGHGDSVDSHLSASLLYIPRPFLDMASEVVIPPVDGTLLTLYDFVDFQKKHNADHPWVMFPSPDDRSTVASISFAELEEASHRIAHMVRPGRKGPDGEVVALILHTDTVLYLAVVIGLSRAGLVVGFLSLIVQEIFMLAMDI